MVTTQKDKITYFGYFVYKKFPPSHRFFPDCFRELTARWIEWSLNAGKPDAWFSTLTFKDWISEYKAKRLVNEWLSNLYQGLLDTKGNRLRWILATEWQIRDVIHFHLLIMGNGLSDLSRKRWEHRWETHNRNAGFCRIYDADRKVAPYLAKYMNKGGAVEWGGTWRGLKTPRSLKCCAHTGIIGGVLPGSLTAV